jgi:WD40 repeat protein
MVALAFSGDGNRIAGVYRDKSDVVVWRKTVDGTYAAEGGSGQPGLPGQSTRVTDLAFKPDSPQLAAAGCNTQDPQGGKISLGLLSFWNVDERQPSGDPLSLDGACFQSLAFSPDGSLLASGDSKGNLHVWRTGRMTPIDVASGGEKKAFEGVRFSPDGSLLVASASDGLWLWRTDDLSAPPTRLREPSSTSQSGTSNAAAYRSLAFGSFPSGTVLASVNTSDDKSIDLWDIVNGKATPRAQLVRGHSQSVTGLDFVDQRTLASLSSDATLRLWDLTDPERTVPVGQPLRGYPFVASALAFSPAAGWLATTSSMTVSGVPPVNNNLILWQLKLDAWETAACRIAGHNLSPDDWSQLLPNVPYDPLTCSKLPAGDEMKS